MTYRTPVALLSLTHNWRRLLASAVGIGFAALLMLTELGFMTAINDSTTLWIDAMNAELVMISRLKDDINPSKPFVRQRLERLRADPEVDAVYPLYFKRDGNWRTSGQDRLDILRLVAFDPEDPAIDLPLVESQRHQLKRPDVALADRKLRDSYGGLTTGTVGELNGRRIEIVGGFELGPDLQMNATLVLSEETLRRVLLQGQPAAASDPVHPDPLDTIDFGLIRSHSKNLDRLAERLQRSAGDDVLVLTPKRLKRRIHFYWLRHQPVGAVFGIGLVVGFLIGMMICYQILFTDVIDQLPQLATLKAIGYPNAYLVRLTVRRSAYLAVAALLLGLPIGALVFSYLQWLTGLTFTLTLGRAMLVSVLTLIMCVLAGLLAMRQALNADPAEVFSS